MMTRFAIRKRDLAIFVLLTALGFAIHHWGVEYLRAPGSDITGMQIRPVEQDRGMGI